MRFTSRYLKLRLTNDRFQPLKVYGPGYELVGSLSLADGLVRPTGMFLDAGNRVIAINAYGSNSTAVYKY